MNLRYQLVEEKSCLLIEMKVLREVDEIGRKEIGREIKNIFLKLFWQDSL